MTEAEDKQPMSKEGINPTPEMSTDWKVPRRTFLKGGLVVAGMAAAKSLSPVEKALSHFPGTYVEGGVNPELPSVEDVLNKLDGLYLPNRMDIRGLGGVQNWVVDEAGRPVRLRLQEVASQRRGWDILGAIKKARQRNANNSQTATELFGREKRVADSGAEYQTGATENLPVFKKIEDTAETLKTLDSLFRHTFGEAFVGIKPTSQEGHSMSNFAEEQDWPDHEGYKLIREEMDYFIVEAEFKANDKGQEVTLVATYAMPKNVASFNDSTEVISTPNGWSQHMRDGLVVGSFPSLVPIFTAGDEGMRYITVRNAEGRDVVQAITSFEVTEQQAKAVLVPYTFDVIRAKTIAEAQANELFGKVTKVLDVTIAPLYGTLINAGDGTDNKGRVRVIGQIRMIAQVELEGGDTKNFAMDLEPFAKEIPNGPAERPEAKENVLNDPDVIATLGKMEEGSAEVVYDKGQHTFVYKTEAFKDTFEQDGVVVENAALQDDAFWKRMKIVMLAKALTKSIEEVEGDYDNLAQDDESYINISSTVIFDGGKGQRSLTFKDFCAKPIHHFLLGNADGWSKTKIFAAGPDGGRAAFLTEQGNVVTYLYRPDINDTRESPSLVGIDAGDYFALFNIMNALVAAVDGRVKNTSAVEKYVMGSYLNV